QQFASRRGDGHSGRSLFRHGGWTPARLFDQRRRDRLGSRHRTTDQHSQRRTVEGRHARRRRPDRGQRRPLHKFRLWPPHRLSGQPAAGIYGGWQIVFIHRHIRLNYDHRNTAFRLEYRLQSAAGAPNASDCSRYSKRPPLITQVSFSSSIFHVSTIKTSLLLFTIIICSFISLSCNRGSPFLPRRPAVTVYVTNEASGDLSVIDAANNEVIATLPL